MIPRNILTIMIWHRLGSKGESSNLKLNCFGFNWNKSDLILTTWTVSVKWETRLNNVFLLILTFCQTRQTQKVLALGLHLTHEIAAIIQQSIAYNWIVLKMSDHQVFLCILRDAFNILIKIQTQRTSCNSILSVLTLAQADLRLTQRPSASLL